MVFSFSSIVNYRRRCNCWKNSISGLWIIRLSVREGVYAASTRYAATDIRYLTFLRLAGHMARYTLKRPVCAITSWKPNVHPARPGKAGRRSLQFAARRRIKMTHRAANQRLRRIQAGLLPSWNGGLEMIISKRPFTSVRRCWQRLHLQHR